MLPLHSSLRTLTLATLSVCCVLLCAVFFGFRPEHWQVQSRAAIHRIGAGGVSADACAPALPLDCWCSNCSCTPISQEWALLSVAFWRFRQFQWRHTAIEHARDKYKEMMMRVPLLPEPAYWQAVMQ
jgi:hypothetical protein